MEGWISVDDIVIADGVVGKVPLINIRTSGVETGDNMGENSLNFILHFRNTAFGDIEQIKSELRKQMVKLFGVKVIKDC